MTDNEKKEFLIKLRIGKKEGGHINNWFEVQGSMYGELLEAKCEEHPNGKPIQTSRIVKIHTIEDTAILETTYSYYYLETESSIDDFYARKSSESKHG